LTSITIQREKYHCKELSLLLSPISIFLENIYSYLPISIIFEAQLESSALIRRLKVVLLSPRGRVCGLRACAQAVWLFQQHRLEKNRRKIS
jgi:hypothetical protein